MLNSNNVLHTEWFISKPLSSWDISAKTVEKLVRAKYWQFALHIT